MMAHKASLEEDIFWKVNDIFNTLDCTILVQLLKPEFDSKPLFSGYF